MLQLQPSWPEGGGRGGVGTAVVLGVVVRVLVGAYTCLSQLLGSLARQAGRGSGGVDGVCLSGPAQPVVGTIKLLQLRYLTDLHRLWGQIRLITFLGGGSNQCKQ